MNMNNPLALVGQLTKVNHSFATIEGYDEKTSMFSVRHLTANPFLLPLPHIRLLPPSEFLKLNPNAPRVESFNGMTEFPVGSIVQCKPLINNTADPVTTVARGPCHVVGRPGGTHFNNIVRVENELPETVTEFNRVCFQFTFAKGSVVCSQGATVFRRCTFGGSNIGLVVGDCDDNVQAVLIDCEFIGGGEYECGLMVNCGSVQLINCSWTNGGRVVACVKRGATLSAHNCAFTNGAFIVPGGNVTLSHCRISDSPTYGMILKGGSTADIVGCHFLNNHGDGVVVQGSRMRTTVRIESSCVEDAPSAFRICGGKVDAQILKCTASKCHLAVYIAEDTIGSVVLSDNGFRHYSPPCLDISGNKCYVRIDDVLQPQGTQQAALSQYRSVIAPMAHLRFSTSSLSRRVLKEANFIKMSCGECGAVAPTGVMYKKCAECKEARYCSRACQKAHWSKHKVDCTLHKLRAETLYSNGYVHCACCHVVEGEPAQTLFSACSGCLKVYYCRKICQRTHWKDHKVVCKEAGQKPHA